MKYFLAFVIFLPLLSKAENNYFCTIKAASEVNEAGSLAVRFEKPYEGQSFSVSKETGVIQGALQNTLGGTPVIIQPAGEDYSFKVFTKSSTNHSDGYYLQVRDFKYANSKPFMFIQSGFIFHGTCD